MLYTGETNLKETTVPSAEPINKNLFKTRYKALMSPLTAIVSLGGLRSWMSDAKGLTMTTKLLFPPYRQPDR